MSPTKKRKVNQEPGSPSCPQDSDSDSSLPDVQEAIRDLNRNNRRIHMQRMERKRRLKEQSATIKELQYKMRRYESKLESLKKENEELKERMRDLRAHFYVQKGYK